ncbi:Homeobox-leucine zipper protein HDG11 [Spatholobus suberectus]|nr:Homeobox-leucine zipper protein HDG11 [Spatholobus suberectus]
MAHKEFKIFSECPHPDERQRRQIAKDLGLEPKQVKFWFQNKRTQRKTQTERANNNALRVENERMHNENLVIKEALKNIICPSCGGPPYGDEGHEHSLKQLRLENARLKEEHEKVSSLLARYLEKQMSPPELQQAFIPITGSSSHAPAHGNSLNQEIDGSLCLDRSLGKQIMDGDHLLSNSLGSEGIEKALMSKVAITAIEELVRLLRINEPFWIKSSTQDGKLSLHHENYEKIFPRTNHFKGANVRVEATKDSGIVSINSIQLVDMFLDSDKWVNLFPTIVTKVETIKVLESGLVGNRSGALQLMFEQMHILSPLVQPREFQFLRYCQQIEEGVWVIADVSFDSFRQKTSIFHSWRHPSGCMIQEMPNGCSMVTWVEHVEVDDKIQTHQLYKDVVGIGIAYGAERWIMELQRICERFACFYVEKIPNHDSEGVINSLEGRRSIMNFSHRMLKIFCESLTMSGNLGFPHLNMENNSGVKVSIRKNTNLGQPNGMIVVAATSIWLPLHYMKVFEFFTDDKRRAQPFIPSENNALILQESFTNPMGSYVVYAPTDVTTMNSAIKGEDSSMLPVLPSGFVISADGEPNAALGAFNSANIERLGGSLLTVAFQILASTPNGINVPNMESVAAVNTLLTSTILKVKDALNCNNLE